MASKKKQQASQQQSKKGAQQPEPPQEDEHENHPIAEIPGGQLQNPPTAGAQAAGGNLPPARTAFETFNGVTTLNPSNPKKPKPAPKPKDNTNTNNNNNSQKGGSNNTKPSGGGKGGAGGQKGGNIPGSGVAGDNRGDKNKPPVEIKMQIGIVRSVNSGDSLTILEVEESRKENAPKEILFTILGLKAPIVGRREIDGKITKDEPWAWKSREFLRTMLIGKPVIFRIEHRVEERNYGELWDHEENDIRYSIILNGWADVIPKPRTNKSGIDIEPSASHLQLENVRDEAKFNERGIWKDKRSKDAIRRVTYHDVYRDENSNLNNDDLYQLYKTVKDKGPLKAVVESVRNGTTYNLILTDTYDYFTLTLSGIRSPVLKPEQQPYAREAKYIAEHFLLGRDVMVTIDGLDKLALYGTVLVDGQNFALNLLSLGLASFVEWTSKETSGLSEKFKEAEKKAQESQLRMWSDYRPPLTVPGGSKNKQQSKNLAKETSITGKVIEIINSGTITVRVPKPEAGNQSKTVDRIITFSSIRLPRGPVKNPKEEKDLSEDQKKIAEETLKRENIYSAEAKDFLRNLLIGQRVRCVFDYPRASRTADEKTPGPVKHYWSVYLLKGQPEKNVALELVQQGYAWVVDHAPDELRAADYKELILAEKAAKTSLKGLHSPPSKLPRNFVNDLTQPPLSEQKDRSDKQLKSLVEKCRHFQVGFSAKEKIEAVVDYVFSGSLFKLTLPSQHCIIMFSLAGAIVEKPYREEVPPKPDISVFDRQYPLTDKDGEFRFGNSVLHFVRDTVFQRKVEINVKKLDRHVFVGQLFFEGKDFGKQLLEKGFAKLHRPSIKKFNFFNAYRTAEETARESKIGLWETYDFEEEKRRIAEAYGKRAGPQPERVNYPVAVTDVRSGSEFSFQILTDDETSALDSLSSSLQNEKFASHPPITPKLNDIVTAQFTVDDLWYRAQIIGDAKNNKEGLYEVRYIDYGNRESLPAKRIRELPKEYVNLLKHQAKDAKLYYLKAPPIASEFGLDSMTALRDLLWDKVLYAEQVRIDQRNKDTQLYHLIIHEDRNDLNKILVRNGHCKVEKFQIEIQDPYYAALVDLQEEARSQRRGIWQYGDDPDDDYEDQI